MVEMTTW